jgi:hypothetical protein
MSKSIIILGKGPSILRCNKEFVDKFDDIAICNYPPLNNFFTNLIKGREIKYHFANCRSFDKRYTNDVNNNLNITGVYNTHYSNNNKPYFDFLQNTSLFKENIRESGEKYIKQLNYNFDPNTGLLAFIYILNLNLYNKIVLVGFDNFEKNKQMYYYEPKEYNDMIKHLIGSKISNSGICMYDGTEHSPDKSKLFFEYIFKNNENIKFELITNMILEKYNNVSVL